MEKHHSSTSNFKNFLLKFLIPAFVIIGTILIAFDFFFEKKIILQTQSLGAYKIYRNINIRNETEIPIFGSSRAAGAYIPDIINSNCFNYGIEKTQYILWEILIKNELLKNKTTPIILNFDYEMWENYIGDIGFYIPNINDIGISNYFKKYDHWYYHVRGIRYYGYYQDYFKNYMGNNSRKNYVNKGGFFLLENTPPGDLKEQIELRKKSPYVYIPNLEKENKLINLLTSDKRRKIFIVIAPYHNSFIKSVKGMEYINLFLNKLRKIPNFYVLDFGDAPYPDELFKNTSHLNYKGAKRFSYELKEKLDSLAPNYF